MLESFIYFVGLYALAAFLYDNLRSPVQMLLAALPDKERPPQDLVQRFGSWAAITGATDGIGKAYARELARKGLNIILISRTESKLKAVAKEIEEEFNVKVKVIVADFTKGAEIYTHIERELASLPVGILVNNVGQNTPQTGIMSCFTEKELLDVIQTNVMAVTLMSRFFLRRMQLAGLKGAIVNISSGTELQPVPRGALYAASKAFTRSLTLALQDEAHPFGITVQLVSPNFVVTKINSYSPLVMAGGLSIPDPNTYARWAVYTLGKVDQTSGYLWHGVQHALLKAVPWRLRMIIIKYIAQYLVKEDERKFCEF